MKSSWPDWTVLSLLAGTLLLVFALVFTQRPRSSDTPPLLWRSTPNQEQPGGLHQQQPSSLQI